MAKVTAQSALQAAWDYFHTTPGMMYGPYHPSHQVGVALRDILKGPWKSVKDEPPKKGEVVEVGWYDQFGTWVQHIAVRQADDTYHSSTGGMIAKPDWWKEPTAPPPNT